MSLEQQYYNLLTRIDHPVFAKDFSDTTTINSASPLNSIINLVIARQLVNLKAKLDEIALNKFPQSVTDLGIDQWEETYFGFSKSGKTLAERITELLAKLNSRVGMSVQDVINAAIAITGQTPTVTRNLGLGGWVLGEGILGLTTIFAADTLQNLATYLVYFAASVDSILVRELDKKLTSIEKGGSTHLIVSPLRFWILGQGTLGVDTTLE